MKDQKNDHIGQNQINHSFLSEQDLEIFLKILHAFNKNSATDLLIQKNDFKFEVHKKGIQSENKLVFSSPEEKEEDHIVQDDSIFLVCSEGSGTIYLAPQPQAEPFVQLNSHVKKGDCLCILETMKVMNSICATKDGIIEKILVNNGDIVDYGRPLFQLRTN